MQKKNSHVVIIILITFAVTMLPCVLIFCFSTSPEIVSKREYIVKHIPIIGEMVDSKGDGQEAEELDEYGLPNEFCLNVDWIDQNPELPTGCEAVALTTVLNYLGYNVDKETIADDFLPKGNVGKVDPNFYFAGDPHSASGYGCFAPAIVDTAEAYFESIDSESYALDISGMDIQDIITEYLYRYKQPVVIWASRDMLPLISKVKWVVDGEEIVWRENNHCMVLAGWNESGYICVDPLFGIRVFEKELFETRYNENMKQAVFVFMKE